ncbi:PQQ-dependent sugar dehydrogenase [Segetibacter sp.]|jgi:glucose/arabinose dehydrogenase|uniref:PQQ-dependent sugar dehydrogenase n=1 Tax=Segetibacter sp. TaxID=2231182 RepID=UPI002601F666|nr:PQQ-dependent sugar dehydrogenase [Segetibacter sp.]MCW3079941.1 glucose sorbosone dehydrogenase [Segetibacter sp.]
MKFNKVLFSVVLIPVFLTCIYTKEDKTTTSSNTLNTTTSAEGEKYTLSEAFKNLSFELPVELVSPEDGTDRIFVIEQKGVIRVFPNKADAKNAAKFLDIEQKVESGGEKGLLGLAFHPNYKSNGFIYVNYTRGKPLESVISRFKVSASNPNMADPQSEQVLLTYLQPYSNHNGGKVAFGNDGFLYIAVGDGGSGGDPGNRAQNKKELLGKILRIDVNNASGGLNYSIPADNPFKNNKEGFREEIYAFGVRNPWRFSFDRQTGTLWAGDVGQNKIEEIDIIENGGNYGWRIMEADECFKSDTCNKAGLISPITSYKQGSSTGNSVTGGYVCRDKSLPELNGKYIYGDFVSGNIWALTYSEKKAVTNELIAKISGGLSSFGEDSKHNLFVLSYGTGKVYKFASAL